jgi:hypothetical protein
LQLQGYPAQGYPAQHAVTDFKWASDRHDQRGAAVPASLETINAAASCASAATGGRSNVGNSAATAADCLAADEFKWISDYVEDAAGAFALIPGSGAVLHVLSRLCCCDLSGVWCIDSAAGLRQLVFKSWPFVHLQDLLYIKLQTGRPRRVMSSSISNCNTGALQDIVQVPLCPAGTLTRPVGLKVAAVHSSRRKHSIMLQQASACKVQPYQAQQVGQLSCMLQGQLLQLPSQPVQEQQQWLAAG